MNARLQDHRAHYKRLLISLGDFFEASDALNTIALMRSKRIRIESLGEGIPEKIRNALLTQAVIAYSRPFLASEGAEAFAKLSPATLGMKLDDAAKLVHRRVLGLRSKVIAHSDYQLRPARAMGASMGFDVPTWAYLNTIDFRRFRQLTGHAVTMTNARLAAMAKKHGDAMFDPAPPRDLTVKLP